jgi:hypothetical protein
MIFGFFICSMIALHTGSYGEDNDVILVDIFLMFVILVMVDSFNCLSNTFLAVRHLL